MKFCIIIFIFVLSVCDNALATKKIDKKEQHKDKIHSIFDVDINNITVEICCLPKRDPKSPMAHVPIGSWF